LITIVWIVDSRDWTTSQFRFDLSVRAAAWEIVRILFSNVFCAVVLAAEHFLWNINNNKRARNCLQYMLEMRKKYIFFENSLPFIRKSNHTRCKKPIICHYSVAAILFEKTSRLYGIPRQELLSSKFSECLLNVVWKTLNHPSPSIRIRVWYLPSPVWTGLRWTC